MERRCLVVIQWDVLAQLCEPFIGGAVTANQFAEALRDFLYLARREAGVSERERGYLQVAERALEALDAARTRELRLLIFEQIQTLHGLALELAEHIVNPIVHL